MEKPSLNELRERLFRSDELSSFERVCDSIAKYDNVCVFGMGNYGQEILPFIKERLGKRLVCVSDNDPSKHGKLFFGVECVHPCELMKSNDDLHVFVAVYKANEIISDLSDKGFIVVNKQFARDEVISFRNRQAKKLYKENWGQIERVYSLFTDKISCDVFIHRLRYNLFPEDFDGLDAPFAEIYSGDQYFPENIIHLTDKEVFIDGGAYTGDTIQRFLSSVDMEFEHIHAFELDSENYQKMEKYIKILDNCISERISTYESGLWHEAQEISVAGSRSGAHVSCGDEMANKVCRLNTLDEMLSLAQRNTVTYIKMDVEGCERNAILGAKQTIGASRPKMAICVYHNPEDVYEVPLLIHMFEPSYKFYFRHHGRDWWYGNETVCYAV